MSARPSRPIPAASTAGHHVLLAALGAAADAVREQVQAHGVALGERLGPGLQEVCEAVLAEPGRGREQVARRRDRAAGTGRTGRRSAAAAGAASARSRSAYCAGHRVPGVGLGGACGRRRRGGRPRRGRRRARAGCGRGRRRRARASTAARPSAGGRPRRTSCSSRGRRDPPAGVLGAELVGRAAAGDHHRQAAGHRLEHRHREALAAVRVDEHVARAVQRRQALAVEVLGQVDDPRQRVAVLAEQRARGAHVLVEGRGADVLDHQGDVVAAREGPPVRLEQHVGALAGDRAADEQQPQAVTRARELGLRALGREDVEVHPVRHDVHPVGLDAGVEVHLPHELARHPELLDLPLQRLDPGARDGPELPGLDQRQPADAGVAEVGRPLVAHLDVGRARQRAAGRSSRRWRRARPRSPRWR